MLLFLPAIGACGGDRATPTGSATEDGAPSVTRAEPIGEPATAAAPSPDAGPDGGAGPAAAAADVTRIGAGRPVWARPVSPRSFSIKLRFTDGSKAVFKPFRRGDSTARHEVAYFRLAEALGVARVPRSTMRVIPLERLERLLEGEHPATAAQLQDVLKLDERRRVRGAMIEWVEGLEPTALAEPGGRGQLTRWLALDGPDPRREPLIPAVAAMVAFDYVAGNWDRFTGGNLFVEAGGERLVLLDNNAAFDRWSAGQAERMQRVLALCQRFPRGLIERLRALDEATIERALAREPTHPEERLLWPGEVASTLARRDALIAHVDALIAEHGAARVLAFP